MYYNFFFVVKYWRVCSLLLKLDYLKNGSCECFFLRFNLIFFYYIGSGSVLDDNGKKGLEIKNVW